MPLFPVFLKLEGRTCLVVGAGSVAAAKIQSLLHAGARVRVVAPRACEDVRACAEQGFVEWIQREFAPADLDGAALAIGATSDADVNAAIYQQARERGVLCNVVDAPALCDFYAPAVVQRGDLQVAIGTGGHSPALAQRLRKELEANFGAEWAPWVARLGRIRARLFRRRMDAERRRVLLHRLAGCSPHAWKRETS
ncbi:MAG: precorrin-2 dehydrogenase/sirohydrochlorin ferrochelatase family protein [Candidatus Acidiferrales bacterium]